MEHGIPQCRNSSTIVGAISRFRRVFTSTRAFLARIEKLTSSLMHMLDDSDQFVGHLPEIAIGLHNITYTLQSLSPASQYRMDMHVYLHLLVQVIH